MSLRALRIIPLALLASLVIVACAAPTEPKDRVVVDVSVLNTLSTIITVEGSVPNIRCSAMFEARATGKGKAAWTGALLRFYAGSDRSSPIDSASFTTADGPLFSRDSISAVWPDTSFWTFNAPYPFGIEAVFKYKVRGDATEHTTQASFDCGPKVPAAAAAPAITLLEVRGSDAVLEAGDTLIVRYRLESGAPLWHSAIRVSGPFSATREFYEELTSSREREERFVVPRNMAAGSLVRVEVETIDVGPRFVALDRMTSVQAVDVRAPTITAVEFHGGEYATGQPWQINVHSLEDNDLEWIIWEFDAPLGRRDSAAVFGEHVTNHAGISQEGVPADYRGGALGLRVWARDAAGNTSAVVRSAVDAYTFYPTVPTRSLGAITLELPALGLVSPSDVVYDANRGHLYATHTSEGWLSRVDVGSMTRLSPIQLPPWPGSLDLTLSGDSLLITQSLARTLSVVDLVTGTLQTPIALTALDTLPVQLDGSRPMPIGVRMAANGKALVMTHITTAQGKGTVEVDLAAGTNRLRTDLQLNQWFVEAWWRRMAALPDRSRILISAPGCLHYYVAATDQFTNCVPWSGATPEAARISFDATANRTLFGWRLLDANLVQQAELTYGNAQIMPDGLHAIVSSENDILKLRISDGQRLSRMVLPMTLRRVFLLPDGQTLLAETFPGGFLKIDISDM